MRIKEHDCVVLTKNLPEESLEAGDVGTVVHIHKAGAAYEVEFITLAGRTVAVATVKASDLRPVGKRDLSHVRELQATCEPMTGQIGLEKAAAEEVVGVLAVRRASKEAQAGPWSAALTPAQRRALSELARGLVQAARQAGAQGRRVKVGGVSFELRENATEEVLSIRRALAA